MPLTQEQIDNAGLDLEFIGEVANGAVDRPNGAEPAGTVTNRTGGTVSTFAKLMSSAAETLSLDGYTLFPSDAPAPVKDRILTVRLFGADPEKFYHVKQFFYHDVGNRFTFTIAQTNDAAGAGEVAVAEFSDGGAGITLAGRQQLDFAAVGGSGITGTAVVDFGNGSTAWAVYDAATSYATTGLPIGVVLPNVDVTAQVQDLIDEAMSEPRQVFTSSASIDYLKELIVEVGVEGGDKSHLYGIGAYETAFFASSGTGGAGLYRINLTVKDFTLGIDVAKYSAQWDLGAGDPVPTVANGRLEEWVFAYGNGTMRNGYVGITAMIRPDWSKLAWNKNFTDVPTYAEAGFLPSLIHSNDDMDQFLWRPNPRKTLTVGAAGDFTSVADAVESLHRYGLVPNNQSTTLPWSNICGYTRQVRIKVIDNWYTEDLNEILMPPYLIIEGKGMGNTVFYHNSPDTNERLAEFRHSGIIQDCTLVQRGPAYIIHADAFNDWSGVAAAGPAVQWFRNRKVLRRVELRHEMTTGIAWGWGSGISSWEYALFDECLFRRPTTSLTAALVGIHSCPGSSRSATVHFRNCTADSFFNSEVILLSGFAQDQRNVCIVEGGNLKMISCGSSFLDNAADQPTLARQRITWDVMGDVPSLLDDDKMTVLAVPPGTVLGGNATGIAALFGTYDLKHGRGEKLINENLTLRKLGVVLGDRTGGGANWNITFDGVAFNFNANYTAMSQADILAAVNATLGAGFMSVVNLDDKLVQASWRQRWIAANGALAAKRFVTIDNDKVRYAHGAARVTASVTNGSAVLTVSEVTLGALEVGQLVVGPGIPLNTTIDSLGTGTGGAGTYNLSANATATKADVLIEGIADRVDGWTVEDMANNVEDLVIESRVFAANYIPEFVAQGDGNYGVVNGVPTKHALPTVCKVHNGLATLLAA
jgi:hypothetical protein